MITPAKQYRNNLSYKLNPACFLHFKLMTELSATEIHNLLQYFPRTELSYETNSHKKGFINDDYGVCIAIPNGRKAFAWFTFSGKHDVCYIMELNRDKKISRVVCYIENPAYSKYNPHLCSILYGTLLDNSETPVFLIEDMFDYAGINLRPSFLKERLSYIGQFLEDNGKTNVIFALPVLWSRTESGGDSPNELYVIPEKWANRIGYSVHHIQYRCLLKKAPFINVLPAMSASPLVAMKNFGSSGNNNNNNTTTTTSRSHTNTTAALLLTPTDYTMNYRPDFRKPQYRMPTVFLVKADVQFDIYRLFAFGKNKNREYCGVAYIANYAKSVFMNSIFRKIKENGRLDAIEESDDEEEFEDTREERFVDLGKEVLMEFVFLPKFKKWQPVKLIQGSHKIVHIGQL